MRDSKRLLFFLYRDISSNDSNAQNFLRLLKFIYKDFSHGNFVLRLYSVNNDKTQVVNNIKLVNKEPYFKNIVCKFQKRLLPRSHIFFQPLELILNFFRFALVVLRFKPAIVYAWGSGAIIPTIFLKRLLNYKVVYDFRGDPISEAKERKNPGWKVKMIRKINDISFKDSDLIFTVSNASTIYGNNEKIIPKFNYYDSDVFFLKSFQDIANTRKNYNLDDKFVFVYSGSTHYYQMLDETMNFFKQFYQTHSDSFFLIISNYDEEYFIEKIHKYKIEQHAYMIMNLSQEEINEIQAMGNMAFLLRENLPLNHHAFPTKFAEYLANGLPILTTPYIYTISKIIGDNRLGEIIEPYADYSKIIDFIYKKYKNNHEVKLQCASFARENLAWQNKSTDFFDKIKILLK